ncbi:hypothetical protein KCU94_g46, partial [Aureobasidium melanogenum]
MSPPPHLFVEPAYILTMPQIPAVERCILGLALRFALLGRVNAARQFTELFYSRPTLQDLSLSGLRALVVCWRSSYFPAGIPDNLKTDAYFHDYIKFKDQEGFQWPFYVQSSKRIEDETGLNAILSPGQNTPSYEGREPERGPALELGVKLAERRDVDPLTDPQINEILATLPGPLDYRSQDAFLNSIFELQNFLKHPGNAIGTVAHLKQEEQISNLEQRLKVSLPEDFKAFLRISNGFGVQTDGFGGIWNGYFPGPSLRSVDEIDWLEYSEYELMFDQLTLPWLADYENSTQTDDDGLPEPPIFTDVICIASEEIYDVWLIPPEMLQQMRDYYKKLYTMVNDDGKRIIERAIDDFAGSRDEWEKLDWGCVSWACGGSAQLDCFKSFKAWLEDSAWTAKYTQMKMIVAFISSRNQNHFGLIFGLLEVVVDNDLVENAGGLCKLELVLGLSETLGSRAMVVAGRVQVRTASRRKKIEGSDAYLHLNIQDAGAVLLSNILDSLDAGAVVVAAELGVLDEALLINELQEFLLGDEVVLDTVLFLASGLASSVLDGEAEAVGVLLEQTVQVSRLARARRPGDDDGTVGVFWGASCQSMALILHVRWWCERTDGHSGERQNMERKKLIGRNLISWFDLAGSSLVSLSSSEPHSVFRPNSDAVIRRANHNLNNKDMATVAGAVQVSRSDLNGSPQSSRASSPDLDTLERLGANLQFEVVDHAPQPIETTENHQDEDEELEFQLFAPTKSTADASTPAPVAQKIRIRSPSEEAREPGIIGYGRPLSYYHTGELDPVRAKEYETAAVSGADVLAMSKLPCTGCAYPWKVITIPSSQAKAALAAAAAQNPAAEALLPDVPKKRTRLGKKDRIKKRQKLAALKAKKEEESKSKEEKERLEREKKARRNREKKFKKRARDKAKKAAGKEGDNADGSDAESDAESNADEVKEEIDINHNFYNGAAHEISLQLHEPGYKEDRLTRRPCDVSLQGPSIANTSHIQKQGSLPLLDQPLACCLPGTTTSPGLPLVIYPTEYRILFSVAMQEYNCAWCSIFRKPINGQSGSDDCSISKRKVAANSNVKMHKACHQGKSYQISTQTASKSMRSRALLGFAHIDLSAPIYGSDGTGIVPNEPDERVEAADDFLVHVKNAFHRQLRKAGPQGDAMRARFGTGEYEFVGQMPVGYTHARKDPDGRRDIRIYGHPSGRSYNSAAKFMLHVVFLLDLKVNRCECDLCGH